jgi:hypothetical protein
MRCALSITTPELPLAATLRTEVLVEGPRRQFTPLVTTKRSPTFRFLKGVGEGAAGSTAASVAEASIEGSTDGSTTSVFVAVGGAGIGVSDGGISVGVSVGGISSGGCSGSSAG